MAGAIILTSLLFSPPGKDPTTDLRIKLSHRSATYNRVAVSWPPSDNGDDPKSGFTSWIYGKILVSLLQY